MKIANLVCGIPLPRAFGKYLERRNPVISAPTVGISTRRHAAPPAGYIRAARRPVNKIKATTTSPTITPMMRLSRMVRLREFAGRGGSGLTLPGYRTPGTFPHTVPTGLHREDVVSLFQCRIHIPRRQYMIRIRADAQIIDVILDVHPAMRHAERNNNDVPRLYLARLVAFHAPAGRGTVQHLHHLAILRSLAPVDDLAARDQRPAAGNNNVRFRFLRVEDPRSARTLARRTA